MLKELSKRQITLEVCPTSYRQTGVMKDLSGLENPYLIVAEKRVCPIAVCTDNPGRNPGTLHFTRRV